MKKQINPNIQAHLAQSTFYLLLLLTVCALPFALGQRNATKPETPTKLLQRTLTFEERVSYQQAIEDVYWRHRIWPKENPDPKPSLDAVMTQAQLERKVEDYLRNSQELEDSWQRPITAGELQAEMDRMAQHTKQPEVLSELFAALGNDSFVIAECLARPVLSERLVTNFYHEQDKEPLGSWRARAQDQVPKVMVTINASYALPAITDGASGCSDDTWAATTITSAPSARAGHTAVWTGTEMIVWGGYDNLVGYSNTGGRYNPSTDSWAATSTTNAPSARDSHTAVWTGIEMIVWGGAGGANGGRLLNTGARYDPSTNSWTATRTTRAPAAREAHTAVWTGTEMIVWGGHDNLVGYSNTGGKYNPSMDSWTPTSTINAPDARANHTAVSTGSEMIVWGGANSGGLLNTGARYDPSTDSWAATSTTHAPAARQAPTAVSTGTEMIVWGGFSSIGWENTGRRYNPSADSWTFTSITNAPDARGGHTAVWTGSEMIVWGGRRARPDRLFFSGGRYNPGTNSWTATSLSNVPAARIGHTAVWTGSEMIVWGGSNSGGLLNTGGRYCAATAQSVPIAEPATYVASYSFTANWSSVSGATGYRLDVSMSSSFSTYVPGYQNLNVGNATSRSVTGLNPSTTYHYRVRAYNGHGTSGNSNIINVTTLCPTGPPVVITNPATYIASFSARLKGSVDPHGLTTTVYFQYGTTTSYGLTTAIQSKTGNTYQNVAANIGDLTASTTYHFRIVATNSNGHQVRQR